MTMMTTVFRNKQIQRMISCRAQKKCAVIIHIRGLVQGVGFRPYIYRLAIKHHISGGVNNTGYGVQIHAMGARKHINGFISEIPLFAPPVAEIFDMTVAEANGYKATGFHFLNSSDNTADITEVSPDIAVCPDCLNDMETPGHRMQYPLINCTNCGPRYSIIKRLPYDRHQTTMEEFSMCIGCADEYKDILNRRFHAQPIACNHCGPQYSLYSSDGDLVKTENIPLQTAQLIDNGRIIAIKGTGGFHLVCDAMNNDCIQRLRIRKQREGKPFAVMFPSVDILGMFAHVTHSEKKQLCSWKRPIVLLQSKNNLPCTVNAHLSMLGALLPYMPYHYLLFKYLRTKAIILTSGNLSGEPVIINRKDALGKLGNVFDFLVDYNRKIYNRTDDSVVQVIDKNIQIIRRSKGFVPKPIRMTMDVDGIFAAGGELKNCFCLGIKKMAIMSQHIGDLKNMETYSFFKESVRLAKELFHFEPATIATDMHPDYLTTQWSESQGVNIIYIQHHHAHIASCLAEHKIKENESVIGLAYDGTGYGTDGHIWGSEIMLCNMKDFQRLGHFEYMPMPGGDKSITEPWRMALGCLYHVFGKNIPGIVFEKLQTVSQNSLETVLSALDKNINITQTCGIGRLFDAVGSLLGLCHYARFEAEGPMKLEAILCHKTKSYYDTDIDKNNTILVGPIIEKIVEDLNRKSRLDVIAARFHNTIIEITARFLGEIIDPGYTKHIVLSGGAFQNRYLLSGMKRKLKTMHIQVLTNHQVPVNDGGIALGQLAVAAAKRDQSCA